MNTPFIMNISASTVRGEHTNKVPVGRAIEALHAGAQAVAYHVNHTSPFEADALRDLGRVVSEAGDLGIPVVAFAYPRGRTADGADDNHLTLREDSEEEFARLVRHCVRLAVELGASAVKTIFTGSVESFRTVVSGALGVPVVIAGERLADGGAVLEKARAAILAGARGVAYGRQIFERDEPANFVRKLRSALDDAWQDRPRDPGRVASQSGC